MHPAILIFIGLLAIMLFAFARRQIRTRGSHVKQVRKPGRNLRPLPSFSAPSIGMVFVSKRPTKAGVERVLKSREPSGHNEVCVAVVFVDSDSLIWIQLHRTAEPRRLLWAGSIGLLPEAARSNGHFEVEAFVKHAMMG